MHQNRFRPRPRCGSLRRFTKPPSRLGGDRRLGRVHSRAFGTPLDLPYHLCVRGAATVCVYCVNCTQFGQLILTIIITRSSADADNGLDAFVGQSRSTNILGLFQVK